MAYIPLQMAKELRINIPPAIGEQAGRRLRQRRKALCMSADDLAGALRVTSLTIYNWERKGFPNSLAASRMERLESTLQVPKDWLLSSEMLADGPPSDQLSVRADRTKPAQDTMIDAATVAEAIAGVAARIALARYKYPRVEPADVDRRNAEMFAARYGTSGPDGALFETIGQANGLTRERVRQITEAMAQESAGFAFRLPILDTVRAELDALLPMPEAQLNETLRPVLGQALTIDDANRFCVEILGMKLVAFLDLGNGPNANRFERVVVTPDSETECPRWVKDIHSLAFDMIRAAGAAHLPTVIGQAVIAGLPVAPENVTGALKVNKGFAWLSEADGWFWFGEGVPARNPLLSTAREIVTAAGGRADVEDIRAGLMNMQAAWARRDDPRLGLAVVPPGPIVRTLLRQVPWLEPIQFNDFRLSGEAASFSEAEAVVLEEVMRLGGVASRSMLKDALVETGLLPPVTLGFILDTSAIFTRVTRGVFGVRGLNYPVAALLLAMETVLGRRPISTNASNTKLSFPFELTPFAARQSVCIAPANLVPMLAEGAYTVEGTGSTIDMVQRASGAFSLNRAVQCMVKLGISVGETVEIDINVPQRVVSISPLSRDPE